MSKHPKVQFYKGDLEDIATIDRLVPRPRSIDRVTMDHHQIRCSPGHPPMSLEDTGRMMDDLAHACERGDIAEVLGLPFVLAVRVSQNKIRRAIQEASRRCIPAPVRRLVLSTGKCATCGSVEQLEVDHIKAYSEGGTHDPSNLQCLCRPCNRKKGPQAWSLVNAQN